MSGFWHDRLRALLRRTVDDSTWPEDLRRYRREHTPPDQRTPLSSVRFVVFDTETTGLDIGQDRLLSIGAVVVRDRSIQISESFERMVRSQEVGRDAAPIHGLVLADLAAGGEPIDVAAAFLAFAASSVLVAHHAAFDVAMIRKTLASFVGAHIENPIVDTEVLARRLEHGPTAKGDPTARRRSLDDLAMEAQVELSERHTAMGDALATATILLRLLARAEQRGIHTLRALLRG